ncbi:MAG: methyltransferase domain-containing protein [Acidobacteriota bacterium]
MTAGTGISEDPVRTEGVAIDRFRGEPTRDLSDWRWLWSGDHRFPIESHRGPIGRLVVALKRLFSPFFRAPLADLWDRQRIFNLILLEHLEHGQSLRHEERLHHLERSFPAAVSDAMRHNDALFARVDQKLDRYRREASDLREILGSALASLEGSPVEGGGGNTAAGPAAALRRVIDEHGYVELERRFRGTEEEIRDRLARYLPHLSGHQPVLDLGCGRGEALAVLGEAGVEARGVDGSAAMVAHCRQRGLEVEEGDLFGALAAADPESLGAVVSFHVVEHLDPESLDALVRAAWRVLRPGGKLILETPNPLSVVVAARNFWLDPTHRRPVHPESLRLSYELAGFEVEHLELRPFPKEQRLPEIDLPELDPEQRRLADRINRLRDQLDDLLFGAQDYALIGTKKTETIGDSEP